ncbi:hypothetical protein SprV_0200679400 [Sparganum proliferum]
MTRELTCYKVDIAAFSGTPFSEQGQLEEVGVGYTFWSGRPGQNDKTRAWPLPPGTTSWDDCPYEKRWFQLRDTVQSAALTVLGRAYRQHQDWFDNNDAATSNLPA